MIRQFGRIAQFDERSREFPITGLRRQSQLNKSVVWDCGTWLNQGSKSCCVGCAIAHELACDPTRIPVDLGFAERKIYWEAQKIDNFPGGEYPGAPGIGLGTSVLAGAKVAKRDGLINSYRWAFGLQDLIDGLQIGPAVLGTKWYESMNRPDKNGKVVTGGGVSGGHAYLCRGVLLEEKMFVCRNSWGRLWGIGGDFKVPFSDMERLLLQGGEACFMIDNAMADGKSESLLRRFLDWLKTRRHRKDEGQ